MIIGMAKSRSRTRSRDVRVGTVVFLGSVLFILHGLWSMSSGGTGDDVDHHGHGYGMSGPAPGPVPDQPEDLDNRLFYSSRHLLYDYNLENCTPPAIEQFPPPIFDSEQRKSGAVAFHIFVSIYMFVALAIVCDDYFVPSCELICEALHLKSDVAGATFMAAGSSAPELATAIIGVFVAKDDIGVGSVVGSAIFNIMFVIGLCGLCAGMVVYLTWYPMIRDGIFYTISIVALVLVIMDEQVHWYEAFILLILYSLYILLMVFNDKLESAVVSRAKCCKGKPQNEESELIQAKKVSFDTKPDSALDSESDLENPAADFPTELQTLLPSGAQENGSLQSHMENGNFRSSLDDVRVKSGGEDEDDDEDGPNSPLSFPDSWFKRILWIICLPIILVLFITVPDCRRERWKKWFILTFTMSIVWIGVFSYLMVWMITVIGFTFGIPDTVMGLTFIAAGSSVPDAIASLLVARDGLGDMAVSNAVGSNVFDILLCLGLPWFIQTAFVDPNGVVEVYSAGLTYSSLTLLTTVVLLILITHINGWKMNKKYGAVLMVIYVAFMVLAILYELNVFGYVHPPTCPSDY